MHIVSGGQTGVDRAALDSALAAGFSCGGWCPQGRLAEDGVIDPMYPLVETDSSAYAERTEWNVRDSDGTLILTWGEPQSGTALTISMAERWQRPCYIVDMGEESAGEMERLRAWLKEYAIATLNVAGPRASAGAFVYPGARAWFDAFFALVAD